MNQSNEKKVRSWVYYEVSSDLGTHFETLNEVEAHYFAKNIEQREGMETTITKHQRTENDSPKR